MSLDQISAAKNSAFVAPDSFIALEPKSVAAEPKSAVVKAPARIVAPMGEEDLASNSGALVIAIMLTRRCNMACAHCSVESGPRVASQPTDDELLQLVRDAAKMGAVSVQLTGGEPMLREDLVMKMLTEVRAAGMGATLTTNGFWGKTPEAARQKTRALCEAGVRRLTVSYDRYHAEFQGSEPAVNIARAFEELDLPMLMSINFTREAGDDLADLVAPFNGLTRPQMRFYDVQAVGRARDMPRDDLRKECGGFCTAACVPAITDDGRMTACNGPAYFSGRDSPLIVGSLKEHSLEELLQKHRAHPILDTIRTFGPMRLRREIEKMPELNIELRDGYSGMCDLCLHVTSQPAAMKALRERLLQPRSVAERFAAQRVMQGEQKSGGDLDRDWVNSVGACQLFLRAILEPAASWANDAARIWGRADFDWNHHAIHLIRCGLSVPLQNALGEKALSRWAPPFFIQKMRRQALHDTLRAGLQREAMRHIAAACRQVGTRGVLLKGTAMMAIDEERAARNNDNEYSNGATANNSADANRAEANRANANSANANSANAGDQKSANANANAANSNVANSNATKFSDVYSFDANANDAKLANIESANAESANARNADIEYSNGEKEYRFPTRACCDVDVVISPEYSLAVRAILLKNGFVRAGGDDGDMRHLRELPPLLYHGVLIEIHQRIMDKSFGLPEREMLQSARPLQSAQYEGLHVLRPEAMWLHSAVHLSGHFFAHGLKTAWDFGWILERSPDFRWRRLETLARKTGARRGFWLSTRVLCDALSIRVPATFLNRAPHDKRQKKLEAFARRHSLGTIRFSHETDPWVRTGFFLLLCDSWTQRARIAFDLVGGRYSPARRQKRRAKITASLHARHRLLEALKKWRSLG